MLGITPAVESGADAGGTGLPTLVTDRRLGLTPRIWAGATVVTNMIQIMTDAITRMKRDCMGTSDD
jgi:hypothetical protein